MPGYRVSVDYHLCNGVRSCNLCQSYFDRLGCGEIHRTGGGEIYISEKSLLKHSESISEAMEQCPRGALQFAEV